MEWLFNQWLALPASVMTFVLGFFTSRYTLSKKERLDVEHIQFETSRKLIQEQSTFYEKFTSELAKYCSKETEPTLDDFMNISAAGISYFKHLDIVCLAILGGRVDRNSHDALVPKIIEATEKTLPLYYEILKSIATKKKFPYTGELKRETYQSVYTVAEKYKKS